MFRPVIDELISESAYRYTNESNAVISLLKLAQDTANHPRILGLLKSLWKKASFAHNIRNLYDKNVPDELEWKLLLSRDGFLVETIEDTPRIVIACSMPSFFPTAYNFFGTAFPLPIRDVCWDNAEECKIETILSNDGILEIFKRLSPFDLLKNVQFVNKRWNSLCQSNLLWNSALEKIYKAGLFQNEWRRPTAIQTLRLHLLCDWNPHKKPFYHPRPIQWTHFAFSFAYLTVMWPLIRKAYLKDISRADGYETFQIDEFPKPEKKRSRAERKRIIWSVTSRRDGDLPHGVPSVAKVIEIQESARSDGYGHAVYRVSFGKYESTPNKFLRLYWEPVMLSFIK